jgi:wobble nucleotide-excising tRNase
VIERFQILRRFGQFDNVGAGAQLPLSAFTLIYGENGRGKSTLAAMLRSFDSRDPLPIQDRQRLGSTQPPHLVLNLNTGQAVFQNGTWTGPTIPVAVYDDSFVAANVCSGIEILPGHRQNLHALVLGAQGVNLKETMDQHVRRNEQHNTDLRNIENSIPAGDRGGLSIDQFCALQASATVEADIRDKDRQIQAALSADSVRQRADFVPLELPVFDVEGINALLARALPDLSTAAATHVQEHFGKLGAGGEAWVEQGIPRIRGVSPSLDQKLCPFCAQEITGSTLIRDYQVYFDEAYRALKSGVDERGKALALVHGGDNRASFERAVRLAVQTRDFWNAYVEIREVNIDTAQVADVWRAAREAVFALLTAKKAAPLEAMSLPPEAIAAVEAYHNEREAILQTSARLMDSNNAIARIKADALAGNLATLRGELTRLRAIQARHSEPCATRCAAYLAEKGAKAATEASRETARAALTAFSENVFPQYQTSINEYLRKFNAGFRLGSVKPVNNRSGTVCSYSVLINDLPVDVMASTGPSFKTTLSAGDRNTLALAFFFSALDADPRLAQMTVVIDDPMTSLDEHRSLTTVQEIRRLADRVGQLIVLSHSKPFLCALWDSNNGPTKTALSVIRDGNGSSLAAWDVHQDCISEHDRRHELILAYIASGTAATSRETAAALRPTLEAFARVAYPEAFPPGTLLGPFIGVCRQRIGNSNQLLSQTDTDELRAILDYANKFHHDTNPAYATETINDQELNQFCKRTIAFTRRT